MYLSNTPFILYLFKYIVWVHVCCPGVKYIVQKILNPKYFGNCSFNKQLLDWLRFVFHFVMKTTALLVKRFWHSTEIFFSVIQTDEQFLHNTGSIDTNINE